MFKKKDVCQIQIKTDTKYINYLSKEFTYYSLCIINFQTLTKSKKKHFKIKLLKKLNFLKVTIFILFF